MSIVVLKKGDIKDTLPRNNAQSILCLLLFFWCWFLEDALKPIWIDRLPGLYHGDILLSAANEIVNCIGISLM